MYDKHFEKAIEHIFELEGYISDNKNDSGGYTKYGISYQFVKDNLQRLQQLGFCKPTLTIKNCIKNLDKETAKKIYYEFFYKPLKLNSVDDFFIKAYCLDMAINMGVKTSIKILQKALNDCGAGLKVDGIIGNKTLNVIKKSDKNKLKIYLLKNRILYYIDVVKRRKENLVFLKGWVNRSFSWL